MGEVMGLRGEHETPQQVGRKKVGHGKGKGTDGGGRSSVAPERP